MNLHLFVFNHAYFFGFSLGRHLRTLSGSFERGHHQCCLDRVAQGPDMEDFTLKSFISLGSMEAASGPFELAGVFR